MSSVGNRGRSSLSNELSSAAQSHGTWARLRETHGAAKRAQEQPSPDTRRPRARIDAVMTDRP